MDQQTVEKPFRVGVFRSVAQADKAVRNLLAAGFAKEQVSVICSDKVREKHFKDLPTPEPGGTHTMENIAAGGVVGATIGGLALATTALVTGGVSLLAAGSILMGGGALAGSFTGAMASRG